MFLLEGSVRVFKNSEEGREITLYRVSPGELCLLSINSMVTGQTYPAAARAETNLRGLMIKANQFREEMNQSEEFRNFVLRNLIDRMTEVMSLVSDIAFRRLDLRLACFLGQQFERSGGESLDITHAALAHELGTTREVISRILKEFERQECVRLSRGKIHLVSPEGLEWFAEEG
jgi:CRP/FNR family transcriptional regulator